MAMALGVTEITATEMGNACLRITGSAQYELRAFLLNGRRGGAHDSRKRAWRTYEKRQIACQTAVSCGNAAVRRPALARLYPVEDCVGAEAAPSVRTEIGIVLGASLWGDEPSPGLRERLNKALELFKEGRFDYIIVSGGLDRPDANFTEAEGMANYLIDHGVSEDRIVLEGESTSTLENLRFSQRMMKERGWTSATIVTHDFHGMRALEIAQALRYEQPQIVTVSSEVLSPLWSRGRESLAYTKWKWDELWIP